MLTKIFKNVDLTKFSMTFSANILDNFYPILTKILDKILPDKKLLNKMRSETCAKEKFWKLEV